jgi:hypothetical protein
LIIRHVCRRPAAGQFLAGHREVAVGGGAHRSRLSHLGH